MNPSLIKSNVLIAEKSSLLFNSIIIAVIGILVNVIVLGAVQWRIIPTSDIITWSLIMVLTLLYRLISYFYYKKSKNITEEYNFWYRIFVSGVVATGLTWSLAVIYMFPASDVVHQIFTAFIFAGVSAASISTLSFDKRLSYLYLVLMLIPLSIRFFMTGSFIGSMMGLMGLAFLGVLLSSSSRFYNQFISNLLLAKEAELANAAKSDFLSSMSHELRTPMNAILSLSQLMLIDDEHNKLTDHHKKNLKEIVHAGDHLLVLINEVLDLSSIESNKFKLSINTIGLEDLLDECLLMIKALAQSNNINLVFKKDKIKDIFVLADHTKLKQVLLNLLSNAIKYNKPDGTVSISIDKISRKQIKIVINDTGYGLSNEELEQLFIPFERLGAKNKNIEGTGIGLVISKTLIEKMNGDIGCESIPGKGSTFWITLDYEIRSIDDDKEEKFHAESQSDEKIAREQLSQYTVLYIEDDPINTIIMEQLIELKPDITLLTATTGLQGLEMTEQKKPDLILLDINLPDISGLDVSRQLKANKQFEDIPIIAVSANAMPDDIEKGTQAGVNDYLVKPIDFKAFNQVLNKYLYHS
jgi:signal transduction histidine kinase/CheY-like chemotaxis protein